VVIAVAAAIGIGCQRLVRRYGDRRCIPLDIWSHDVARQKRLRDVECQPLVRDVRSLGILRLQTEFALIMWKVNDLGTFVDESNLGIRLEQISSDVRCYEHRHPNRRNVGIDGVQINPAKLAIFQPVVGQQSAVSTASKSSALYGAPQRKHAAVGKPEFFPVVCGLDQMARAQVCKWRRLASCVCGRRHG
jgi:hypothetical protein